FTFVGFDHADAEATPLARQPSDRPLYHWSLPRPHRGKSRSYYHGRRPRAGDDAGDLDVVGVGLGPIGVLDAVAVARPESKSGGRCQLPDVEVTFLVVVMNAERGPPSHRLRPL